MGSIGEWMSREGLFCIVLHWDTMYHNCLQRAFLFGILVTHPVVVSMRMYEKLKKVVGVSGLECQGHR